MDKQNHKEGLLLGAMAYTIWGLLPLYWKLVNVVSSYQIFAHRILWSLVFLTVILLIKGQIGELKEAFSNASNRLNLLFSTVFISINWFVFIWAVNHGYVIETSLGYFINPLVLTAFGALLFKERLRKLQKVGLLLAGGGVLYLTLLHQKIPYIALVLAVSFALYGVFKKKSKLGSLKGLTLETLLLAGPVLIYILYNESTGQGFIGNTAPIYWLLITLSGVATATPLLLYGIAAQKLPLSVLGFLQYISPTISLILGIFVFKETFDSTKLLAFICIWIAIGVYSYDQYQHIRSSK